MTAVNKALLEWNEYQMAQEDGTVKESQGKEEAEEDMCWKKPQASWIKVNTDAALNRKINKAGGALWLRIGKES